MGGFTHFKCEVTSQFTRPGPRVQNGEIMIVVAVLFIFLPYAGGADSTQIVRSLATPTLLPQTVQFRFSSRLLLRLNGGGDVVSRRRLVKGRRRVPEQQSGGFFAGIPGMDQQQQPPLLPIP